jgi:hypothetical protein
VVGNGQAPVLVEHLWVSWDALRFYGCSNGLQESVATGVIVDLVAGAAVEYRLPDERFCAITSTFVPAKHPLPTGAPIELSGRSMLIQGRRADGARFTIASELTPILRLQSSADLPLGSYPTDFVLSFDVAAAFAGMNLQLATADESVVKLDNVTNETLLAELEEQMFEALTLHVDADSDARVGPSEPMIAAPR